MTKVMRMMREMRRRSGVMIPVMIDPFGESGFLRRCSEGKPQKNARLTSLLI